MWGSRLGSIPKSLHFPDHLAFGLYWTSNRRPLSEKSVGKIIVNPAGSSDRPLLQDEFQIDSFTSSNNIDR